MGIDHPVAHGHRCISVNGKPKGRTMDGDAALEGVAPGALGHDSVLEVLRDMKVHGVPTLLGAWGRGACVCVVVGCTASGGERHQSQALFMIGAHSRARMGPTNGANHAAPCKHPSVWRPQRHARPLPAHASHRAKMLGYAARKNTHTIGTWTTDSP